MTECPLHLRARAAAQLEQPFLAPEMRAVELGLPRAGDTVR